MGGWKKGKGRRARWAQEATTREFLAKDRWSVAEDSERSDAGELEGERPLVMAEQEATGREF